MYTQINALLTIFKTILSISIFFVWVVRYKNIREEFKKVNVSINGETLRVTSKSKNDLQLTIKLLDNLEETYKIPLQSNNYR